MAFWRIQRPTDGRVAVIEADTVAEAVRIFESRYDNDELYVEESDAGTYAEFLRDEANEKPWYS